MVGAGMVALTAATMLLTGCSGGDDGAEAGATTGTLDFYTDKAAWEPDFDELNTTSKDAVDISLNTPRATPTHSSTTRSSSSRSAPTRARACSPGTPAIR
jgi:hypothetical protein